MRTHAYIDIYILTAIDIITFMHTEHSSASTSNGISYDNTVNVISIHDHDHAIQEHWEYTLVLYIHSIPCDSVKTKALCNGKKREERLTINSRSTVYSIIEYDSVAAKMHSVPHPSTLWMVHLTINH